MVKVNIISLATRPVIAKTKLRCQGNACRIVSSRRTRREWLVLCGVVPHNLHALFCLRHLHLPLPPVLKHIKGWAAKKCRDHHHCCLYLHRPHHGMASTSVKSARSLARLLALSPSVPSPAYTQDPSHNRNREEAPHINRILKNATSVVAGAIFR